MSQPAKTVRRGAPWSLVYLIVVAGCVESQRPGEPPVSSNAAPLTGSNGVDYVLGAYYFGTYSPTFSHRLDAAQAVYGRRDPWAGTRDYHGDDGVSQSTDGWTPLANPSPLSTFEFGQYKPALGYYNEDLSDILYKQIVQARSHGISFFNFYWYYKADWTAYNGVREVVDAALFHDPGTGAMQGSFLAANDRIQTEPGSPTLKFMITVYANDGNGDYSPLDRSGIIAGEIVRRWLDYMGRYDYLRTRDGRPIISFGANVSSDPTLVRDYIALLKVTASQQGKPQPFVVMEHDEVGQAAVNVDGFTCLNLGGMANNGRGNIWSYATWVNQFTSKFSDASKPWMPCFMDHFDEKARTDLEDGGNKAAVRYVDDWSPSLFNTGLTRFRDAIADRRNGNPIGGYGMLYAWNEWAESLVNLEPSDDNQHWALSQVASVFGFSSFPAASHQWCSSQSPSFNVFRTSNGADHGLRYPGYWGYPSEGLSFVAYATQGAGMHAIYNCRASGWDEMISGDPGCEGQPPTSPSRIGYVWDSPSADHSRAIYRCNTGGEHMVSTDPNCEIGRTPEGILGYVP